MPWKFFTEGTGTWSGAPPSQGIFLKCYYLKYFWCLSDSGKKSESNHGIKNGDAGTGKGKNDKMIYRYGNQLIAKGKMVQKIKIWALIISARMLWNK